MKTSLVLIVLILQLQISGAQHQTDYWYFGVFAGMNFSSGAPIAIQGALNTTEGTTTASDSMGALLFYSDGVNVWNKNGSVMPNGSGLFGSVSSTVSALAVPHPGNPDLHYIFTTDEAQSTNGFCYSVVDMSLQSGDGDVTLKNVPILANVTEKITAVSQPGTGNYWVVTHEWGTDAFYAYLVDATGFQSTPVISNAGMVHTIDPLEQNKYGQMKFNTCGTQIAVAIGYTDTVQVVDFDPVTGMASNAVTLPLGDHVYGVEFSRDNSKLYVTSYNTSAGYANLVQYDLSSGDPLVIPGTMTIIATNNTGTSFYYALQAGLDGRIYLSVSWSPFLGVIATPNFAGAACGFTEQGFDLDPNFLGVSASLGLPAFVQSYFRGEVICNTPIGLPESNDIKFSIQPVASSTTFLLNFENEKNIRLEIFDTKNSLVLSNHAINVTGYSFGDALKPGIYIARVTGTTQQSMFRIVKL